MVLGGVDMMAKHAAELCVWCGHPRSMHYAHGPMDSVMLIRGNACAHGHKGGFINAHLGCQCGAFRTVLPPLEHSPPSWAD